MDGSINGLEPSLSSLFFFFPTGSLPEQNPCFTGRHGCDINAVCRAGEGLQFACECANGFAGDGRYCYGTETCSLFGGLAQEG